VAGAAEGQRRAGVRDRAAQAQGDLTLTVSANGTLQPTRSVNIGSELSGTVRACWST
jgi:hypothetical protein